MGLVGVNCPEKVISVDVFDLHDSVKFLRTRLSQTQGVNDQDLEDLAHQLENIPLAMSHAAAYLSKRSWVSAQQYITNLRSDTTYLKLLNFNHDSIRRDAKGSTAATNTFHISFDQAKAENPLAARVLAQMSLLGRQGLPAYIWIGPSEPHQSHHRKMYSVEPCHDMSQMDFDDAVGILHSYSLLQGRNDMRLFNMHRIVQLGAQSWLGLNNEFEASQDAVLNLVAVKYPYTSNLPTPANAAICEALEPLTQSLLDGKRPSDKSGQAPDKSKQCRMDRAILQLRRGLHMAESGKLTAARELILESISILQDVLGKFNLATLMAYHSLAEVMNVQGCHDEAFPYAEQAARGLRERLGVTHEATLDANRVLAEQLEHLDELDESEKLLRETLEVCKDVTSPDHGRVKIELMSGLSSTLGRKGLKYTEEALLVLDEALEDL